MRELMFRAWALSDKYSNGRMFYPEDEDNPFLLNMHGDLINSKSLGDFKYINTWARISYNGIIKMQFTGLKDKYGKEIYEGDILRFFSQRKHGFQEDGKSITLSPVEFGEFYAKDDTLYKFIGGHIDGSSIHYKLPHGLEIIGNIYQNPELIK